jgi:hypothetical protein
MDENQPEDLRRNRPATESFSAQVEWLKPNESQSQDDERSTAVEEAVRLRAALDARTVWIA